MKTSIFHNFTKIIRNTTIDEVLFIIQKCKYKEEIEALQKLISEGRTEEYTNQKKSLLAFTPSGTFEGGRKLDLLKEYSGIIILDFDKLTESHLNAILEKTRKIPYTFSAFKSPSGNGCKILVKVSSGKENHLDAFKQVSTYYENTLALHVDPSGKDITRLCFFSSDPFLYYNPESQLFPVVIPNELPVAIAGRESMGTNNADVTSSVVEKPNNVMQSDSEASKTTPKPPVTEALEVTANVTDDIENIITQLEQNQIDITSNYPDWLKICFALIDALGSNARTYFHRISAISSKYNYSDCNKQFDHCINHKGDGVKIATFFGFTKDHGIIVSKKKPLTLNPIPEKKPEKENVLEITGKKKKYRTNKFHLVRDYLLEHFDIRFNTVSTEFEYKEKDQEEYKPLNENEIFISMAFDGLTFSLNNLMAILKSNLVSRYNPFTQYFNSLQPWDENADYIQNLASFIKLRPEDRDRFNLQFKKWLVRVVKCSIVDTYFNKQAFILVHDKQNSGKSTFCRFLCPPILSNYIAENLSIDKDSRILLTTNLLINLDELSTLSKFEINSLKSLFSKDKINDRLPYDRKNSIIPRRASFIGSTNQAEFLNDESGSVRWLCFVIESIDWSYKEKINIDAVWAQAYHLFKSNYICDLNPTEIKENDDYNKQFHITTPEFELIQKYFLPATKEANDCFMTSTDILLYLGEETNGRVKLNTINIGRALKMLSFIRENKYPEKKYGYWIYKKLI